MKRKNAMILGIAWLMIMVSIAASTVTLLVSERSSQEKHWVSSGEYDVIDRYSRLEEVRSALKQGYYQEVDDEQLLTGAIRGMMASLEDPYTFYYTPDEMKKHDEESQGAYHGVGLLVQNNADGLIEIIRVYADGPAEAAGAKMGDLILKVDGVEVSGETAQTLNAAVDLMKGEDGAPVVLTVKRGQQTLDLTAVRGDVTISNVSHSMLEDGVGYIGIYQFTGDDVTAFKAALNALESANARALVIDLRNNPGGLLDDVVAIADMLLPEGLVVYTEDRAGSRQDYYSDGECSELPVAVLINGMSASASEILAAAVQDRGRGVVVGEQSYGKGIVQTIVDFEEDGAGMQYTSSCYYTPSGKNIHGTGVTPDIEVGDGADFVPDANSPDAEADAQLRAALNALREAA